MASGSIVATLMLTVPFMIRVVAVIHSTLITGVSRRKVSRNPHHEDVHEEEALSGISTFSMVCQLRWPPVVACPSFRVEARSLGPRAQTRRFASVSGCHEVASFAQKSSLAPACSAKLNGEKARRAEAVRQYEPYRLCSESGCRRALSSGIRSGSWSDSGIRCAAGSHRRGTLDGGHPL